MHSLLRIVEKLDVEQKTIESSTRNDIEDSIRDNMAPKDRDDEKAKKSKSKYVDKSLFESTTSRIQKIMQTSNATSDH